MIDRIRQFIEQQHISTRAFEQQIGASNGLIRKAIANNTDIQSRWIAIIVESYPQINEIWLLTGKGEMFKHEEAERRVNLIPFYDDVVSVGGVNEIASNMDGVSQPSEFIDTGDWFRNSTAAIRHYGDSMTEYPSGCILAIKEVADRELIIWGKDYVIETSEYRITKRVQTGNDDEHIRAYSTNKETYPDGRLIHEPINIHYNSIVRMFLVLGYVVKKGSSVMIFNNSK